MSMERAVAECKELKQLGLCPRECEAWRPKLRKRRKFCKLAESAARKRA